VKFSGKYLRFPIYCNHFHWSVLMRCSPWGMLWNWSFTDHKLFDVL